MQSLHEERIHTYLITFLCVREKQQRELKMGEELSQETHHSTRKKGGLITMPFIIANEAFERVASYGLVPNMILYLMSDYNVGVAKGTNIIFLWTAATNFAPILGAFLADSYLGSFLTIGFGSLLSSGGA
ncbi:putative proton-dependent oligopeptide transporter family, PTR2 family proton/oligopeptide symporter [Helianthus annuus]|nr:putative proton-dependent oligopeptide transporter family, PTR2 family proton/oligopeptide symporter [Helianthus annuus]KAJ0698203.1 putative proton-dependent oligopeptide transporter family, PTR2 family proton/oligopeptide symporter [Helianthus annuus]KAJ0881279.1 putative proton-dependent oligopeptide transporter family, PTR2 family proton/oligopeptide symporter [Helianthus annuus]